MAEKWSLEPKVVSFPTAIIHRPHYATKDLHNTYVDSMSWWGDLIISRSAEQSIAIWKCGKDETEDDLMELKVKRSTFFGLLMLTFDFFVAVRL